MFVSLSEYPYTFLKHEFKNVQSMDRSQYYIASDNNLLLDIFKSEINFLKSSWHHMLGRPMVVFPIRTFHLGIVLLDFETPFLFPMVLWDGVCL